MADWSSIFSAIAAVGAAVSAAISLFQQIKAKKLAADVRKINNETIWYNKIALDTVVTQLNNLIDRAERNIDGCKKGDREITDLLETVNKELNSDINSLSELLFLLNIFDDELFRKCSEKLEIIRDVYSEVINKSLERKRIVYYNKNRINSAQKEIVEELWLYAKLVTE